MLFGFDTFARVPFAAIDDHNNVTINSGANALTIAVGPLAIASSSVIEQAAGDPLTLNIGSITITTEANLTATAAFNFRCWKLCSKWWSISKCHSKSFDFSE